MQASDIIQDEQELRAAQILAGRLLTETCESIPPDSPPGRVAIEATVLSETIATLNALIAKVRDRNDRLQDTEQALGVMQNIVRDLTDPAAERPSGEVRNLARTLEVVIESALQNGEPADDRPRKRAR